MATYRLKISLAEPFLPITELHRLIDIDGSMTFDVLADVIGLAFASNINQWQFFMSRIKTDNLTKLQAFDVINKQHVVAFETINLQEKEYFYLHADALLYRIRIEKQHQNPLDASFVILKSLGNLPSQTTDAVFDPKHISPELDFEMTLISAVMLIAGDVENPVYYGDLVEMGVIDELMKRSLIEPYRSLGHIAKLTAKGESELVRIMGLLGM